MRQADLILEGVHKSELALLRALDGGRAAEPVHLRRLADKGLVDMVEGVPLITITGRTLLDQA